MNLGETAALQWPEYARLFALLLGVGFARWKGGAWLGPGVLAALLVLLARYLLPPAGVKGSFLLVWAGLLLLGVLGALVSGACWKRSWSLLEWTVAGVALALGGLGAGAAYFPGVEGSWAASVQGLFFALVWLLLAPGIAALGEKKRWLETGILGALSLGCMVGGVRAGRALYHYEVGAGAEREQQYERALFHYERSLEYGREIGLEPLEQKSRLGLARSLVQAGEGAKAAAVLGMEADWKRVVRPGEWEGPTGGYLFKNVSCWKDLWFYRGEVEIRVQAAGGPARGIWPRMRVRLGGRLLGEVEVGSRQVRTYSFSTPVETGRQRLELSLRNDFWEPGGEDRWMRVGRVVVEYGVVGRKGERAKG